MEFLRPDISDEVITAKYGNLVKHHKTESNDKLTNYQNKRTSNKTRELNKRSALTVGKHREINTWNLCWKCFIQ